MCVCEKRAMHSNITRPHPLSLDHSVVLSIGQVLEESYVVTSAPSYSHTYIVWSPGGAVRISISIKHHFYQVSTLSKYINAGIPAEP